ncbi:zf-HC2 domain-containing protein [Ideonella sp. BN130291]|uniref:anti-sigma factor family protein n=1 Tax=Ideonella sp. BN130291 TaxID=3112940 RepID=UPI002E26EB4D|nr:zf-HC2 domain-containing protein [Ideonella sp. BN130291]
MSYWIRKLYAMRVWPRRTCRQVTEMVLRNEDQALRWHERVAVRLHMQICVACPRFLKQVQFMREATGRWRRYAEGGDEAP